MCRSQQILKSIGKTVYQVSYLIKQDQQVHLKSLIADQRNVSNPHPLTEGIIAHSSCGDVESAGIHLKENQEQEVTGKTGGT